MAIRVYPTKRFDQRITMSRKEYNNTILGLLIIFSIIALFSALSFFLAIIALCK